MSIPLLAPTRRQAILGLAGASLAFPGGRNTVYNPMLAAHTSMWRAEAIARKKRPAEMIDEAFAATKRAGYGRVQVIPEFLAPSVREKTLARLAGLHLELSIVCVEGPLHCRELGDETRAETAATARTFLGTAEHIAFRAAPHPDGRPKTDGELDIQAYELNLMGQDLAHAGLGLIVEHEDAEMKNDAREWRHMLSHTEARYVAAGLDVECAVRAGANPWALIDTAAGRLRSVHLRNTSHGRVQEKLGDGDMNMPQIASLLRAMQYDGYLVVELAPDFAGKREHPPANALALSRAYVHMVFGSRPGRPAVDMGPHIRLPRR